MVLWHHILSSCNTGRSEEEYIVASALFTAPLFHVFGFVNVPLLCEMVLEEMNLLEQFNFNAMPETIEQTECIMSMLPPLVLLMAKSDVVVDQDLKVLEEVAKSFAAQFLRLCKC